MLDYIRLTENPFASNYLNTSPAEFDKKWEIQMYYNPYICMFYHIIVVLNRLWETETRKYLVLLCYIINWEQTLSLSDSCFLISGFTK